MTEPSTDHQQVKAGLRKLLKEGRVSPASVLACPELVSLASAPSSSTVDEGAAAATVTRALRLAIESMKERDAINALFGFAPSIESESLQRRREKAATLLGLKAESFRVRREAQLLDKIAHALVVELARPRSDSPSLPPSGKPKLFVSSSSKARHAVEWLSLDLADQAIITRWSSLDRSLTGTTLEAMERVLAEADFAAFVLAEEDVAVEQDRHMRASGNILLELGLAIGRLGAARTFVLAPKGVGLDAHPAFDLGGIPVIYYELGDENQTAQLARQIWEEMQAQGPRSQAHVSRSPEHGDTGQIEMLADAAVGVDASRDTYIDELRRAVRWGERVPAKFQFAHADGGRYWLRLCRSIDYGYFQRGKEGLFRKAPRLAELVHEAAGTAVVDLVSLGCGDGRKDDILLRALAGELADRDEFLCYYPVEISDILLVEALRHISRNGLRRSHFRCKAILGDFTNLQAFGEIFEYRPTTNLFSVLGNTIGSFDEAEILTSIERAMLPGDLVLIEANIGRAGESEALLEDETAVEWDLSTMEALGFPRDSCDLGKEVRENVSIVPGTETLVSYALSSAEKPEAKYMLSAMHHYDFGQLEGSLAERLGVEWIEASTSKGVGLLLGQRSR